MTDPTPARVTLTDDERADLARVDTGHHPDHCDCGDPFDEDPWCENAHETFAAVERILATREAAVRAQIKADDERWGTAVDWLLNSRYSYDAVTPFYAFYDGVITEEELRAESVSHAEIEARRAARIAGGEQ